ncbi:MAG TPA: DNA-directed RNA polymerase subunit omega [Sulfurospirillum sp. UBA11407]|jgi:DNA-directed RNA polymerase subunit omega|nr:MAG TPA: DNA-directed RNA polymerase subunit omega [Sulfurospirillum sp. UBA11407]DAB34251.1 MAG TPA: DNA-directed RNA polymerase subunit omega [Sulfurospirillum sp. UBA12182]
MRTEQIAAEALKAVNDDRYKLSLLVAKRAEQLSNGAEPVIKADKAKEKFTDIALKEIASGKITMDYISEN